MRHALRLAGLACSLNALSAAPFVLAEPPSSSPRAEQPKSATLEYGATATASRLARPLLPVPAAVTVLTRAEIERNPTLTSDALLRSVPSAMTFRRSSSLSADPSSQGLNLRGVAPSGVSRTMLLVDGVPANDPFAGSIYFRALPRLGLERVEVVPGGGSALYGSSALSGVVQLFSRPARSASYDADLSYGLLNTLALATRAAGSSERINGSIEADWLSSDGFRVVSPADRGPIDGAARSLHGTLIGKGRMVVTKRLDLSASLSLFREQLGKITRFTNARVQLATLSLRADYNAGARGRFMLLAFGRLASFDQERARVSAARDEEALAGRQHVPAHDQGLSATWTSGAVETRTRTTAALGIDLRHVTGVSRERLYPMAPTPESTRRREAGGRQVLSGAFAEAHSRLLPMLEANAALRVDWVHNYAGELASEAGDGERTEQSFARQNQLAFNPRLGFLLSPLAFLRVRASAYRSFRAATLNELYRPFQVGTVLTAANPRLRAEALTGAELGIESVSFDVLTVRATGFWNLLHDPIINASLAEPLPDGAMRQRRNLRQARVVGAELSLELRLWARFSALLAYTFVDARVTKQGPLANLTGKRLAQDPAHRASALLSFEEPKILSASVQVRLTGGQYEDDLNTLRMKGYAVLDVLLARTLFWHVQAFVAAENLLNQRYLVGRAGVDTIGAPLLVRAGLRIRSPQR